MRTLYLLRHAKSSWDDPDLADHDRPLAGRGERATPYVAAHMLREGIAPQLILCSSARRTRETLGLLGDAVPLDCEVLVEDGLYGASADDLIRRLQVMPDTADHVMLIGHNPALQRLAWLLARSGDRLSQLNKKFPTAALATLHADVDDWSQLSRGCARLTGFVRPRDLNAPR